MKFFNSLILCSIFFLFTAHTGTAKDLFVATTGSDAVSYDNNSISNPWATVSKAWNDARTDDVVYYRAGDYFISSTINIADGGHNVTHTNYNNEVVSWSSTLADSTIEVGEPNTTIDGINVNSAASGGDDGFFRLGWNSNGSSPSGFTLRNCIGIASAAGQNTGIVHMRTAGGEYADGAVIENCRFTGPGAEVGTINSAGIIMFQSRNWIIRNCEISNFNTAIFYNKHANDKSAMSGEIRNNYIHSTGAAIRTQANYINIINNILDGNVYLGYDGGSNETGDVGSDYNNIEHNTIIGRLVLEDKTRSGDDLPGAQYNTLYNNILLQLTQVFPYGSGEHNTSGDYNLFPTGDLIYNNRAGYTLSEWQSMNMTDYNSISAAPVFVGGDLPSTIDGYALSTISAGVGSASDGTDIGADVSQVGINGSGGQSDLPDEGNTSPLSPVTNFRLITSTSNSNECNDYVTSHPDWIFCDDFESDDALVGDKRYYEHDNNDGDFIPVANAGIDNSKGMQTIWQSGEIDAGHLSLGFGRNPSSYMNRNIHSDKDFREIYYRMYVKHGPGWEGNPYKLSRTSVVSSSDWSQAMIAHLWISNSLNDTLAVDPTSCVTNGVVQCSGWNDTSHLQWLGQVEGSYPIFSTENSGQWNCIEVHVKLNDPGQSNGIHEYWIDGALQARASNLNFIDTYTEYGLNHLSFENYWNGGSPLTQQRYFDNIVVSTSPIGCQ